MLGRGGCVELRARNRRCGVWGVGVGGSLGIRGGGVLEGGGVEFDPHISSGPAELN